ncbi:MAG: hypothetical protein ABIG61_04325 [Planctomycetota bacterium]
MKYVPDTYTLKARIAPVLLVALPLTLIALCWRAEDMAKWKTVWSVVLASGGGILLAQLGRSRGKLLEPKLFEHWGGKPTTLRLRHKNSLNPELVNRYHKNIVQIMPEIQLPTKEEEEKNPQQADNVYDSTIRALIAKTRDTKKFPLIFKENCNYGFRRNLWGLKRYGVFLATVGCISVFGILIYDFLQTKRFKELDTLKLTCLCISIILCYIWFFVIRKDWIKVAADAYADRLLESTEILGNNQI